MVNSLYHIEADFSSLFGSYHFSTYNYDFLIEKSLDNTFTLDKVPLTTKDNSNKYNINNYTDVSNKAIYHIHGDLRRAQSICLGYEHYAGTIQHLRQAIATKKDIDKEKAPAIVWTLRDIKHTTNCWAEKFFTNNIHIIGLGLTQSEIDVWWLITYRATLLYSNRFNCQKIINNKITYHDIGTELDENLKFTLENLGIEYYFYYIPQESNECYLEKYIELSKTI